MAEGGALEGLQIARYRGLIDYIGISSHSLEVLEKAIACGEFDTVMLEYSAFYRDTERLLPIAKESDVGVIAMRPLGGSGRMSSIRTRVSEGDTSLTARMLLSYVLSNPGISTAIPGTRYPSRVRENVESATSYQRWREGQPFRPNTPSHLHQTRQMRLPSSLNMLLMMHSAEVFQPSATGK